MVLFLQLACGCAVQLLWLREACAGVLYVQIACGCAALPLWLRQPCAGVLYPKQCMYMRWNAAVAVFTAAGSPVQGLLCMKHSAELTLL
jgi:hypothetical protein